MGWLMRATISLTGTLFIAAFAQQAQPEKLCIWGTYYLPEEGIVRIPGRMLALLGIVRRKCVRGSIHHLDFHLITPFLSELSVIMIEGPRHDA